MPYKNSKNSQKKGKALKTAVKLLVSLATLAIVLNHCGATAVLQIMSGIKITHIMAAVALFILSIYISSIRWRTLLNGIITKGRAFNLYMTGSFYNTILPGAVSGDAVRAYCLYKDNCEPALATASVFTDRYIGFLALFAIAATAFPFTLPYLTNSTLRLAFPIIALLFALATAAMLTIRPGSRIQVISNFYKQIGYYAKSRCLMAKAFLISLPVQACSILITYVISKGLGMHVTFLHLCAVIPIIATITLIPISISGIGIREALFITLMAPAGLNPTQATALSIASFLVTVIGSTPGIFLTTLPSKKTPDNSTQFPITDP